MSNSYILYTLVAQLVVSAKLLISRSHVRSVSRVPLWRKCMKQWIKDFIHNCVIHPLMPFMPVAIANKMHDANANWAFGLNRYDEIALENSRGAGNP